MHTADLILLLAGFVAFATIGVPARINLVGPFLACWILIPLITLLNTSS